MEFAEVLARLARTPKASVDKLEKQAKKDETNHNPPRPGGRKAA
jgi:hypothetical protein